MYRFRQNFRAGVLWAMIPLALLGTRPVVGCLCAELPAAASCCAHSQAQHGNSGCCESDCLCSTRCTSSEADHDGTPRVTGGACTCSTVAQTPVVVPVTKSTTFDLHDATWVPAALDSTVLAANDGRPPHDAYNTGPPVDLIVTLGRLLI